MKKTILTLITIITLLSCKKEAVQHNCGTVIRATVYYRYAGSLPIDVDYTTISLQYNDGQKESGLIVKRREVRVGESYL